MRAVHRRRRLGVALIAGGALTWIIAARVDQILNAGDGLGACAMIAGILLLATAAE